MNLDPEIYQRFLETPWLRKCGTGPAIMTADKSIIWLTSTEEAILNISSTGWVDAGTEAQGELTGYLARNHYNSYGGHWNRLARESRSILDSQVKPEIEKAIVISPVPISVLPQIMLDLNRIALFSVFHKQFKKIPDFFGQLASIYEAGFLPCGWKGDLNEWPKGHLVVY